MGRAGGLRPWIFRCDDSARFCSRGGRCPADRVLGAAGSIGTRCRDPTDYFQGKMTWKCTVMKRLAATAFRVLVCNRYALRHRRRARNFAILSRKENFGT